MSTAIRKEMMTMTVLLVGGAQAMLEAVLAAVRDEGITPAHGTIAPDEAHTKIAAGQVRALVIGGGIDDQTREALRQQAQDVGVPVVESGLHGRDPTHYVHEDLAPQLRKLGGTSARAEEGEDTSKGDRT